MFKAIGVAMVLLALVGGVAVGLSPAMRAAAHQQWTDRFGWTEEARRIAPVRFAQHAERRLAQDLDQMKQTRRELAAEVGQLVRRARQQQALHDQGATLADEFRAEYQEAEANGGFPITVRNAAYTRPQAEAQVSMLLAETAGYEQSLALLEGVRQQAEAQLEALAVKINQTEAQLATLATKRELLRAGRLTAEGERLLAQVDELMTGNARVIAENPVRTVEELLAATPQPANPAGRQAVAEFLAQRPAATEHRVMRQEVPVEKPEMEAEADADVEPEATISGVPATFEAPTDAEPVRKPRNKKRRPADDSVHADARPIFQQW